MSGDRDDGYGHLISSTRTHVRCSSLDKHCAAVSDMSTLLSSASPWRTIWRDSSSRHAAGHSHNDICLELQLWLWLWQWRRWCCLVHHRLALLFVVALLLKPPLATLGHVPKDCSTNVFFKALLSDLDHGVDHLFECLHGRTTHQNHRDELASAARRSLVNHHHQHPLLVFTRV